MSEKTFEEKITTNRNLPIPGASGIPDVPAGYQPTDPGLRTTRFHKVARDLEAELLASLKECAELDLPALLGEYAPPASEAATYAQELAAVRGLLAKLELLTTYAQERKSILLNDGRSFTLKLKKAYEYHIEKKPGLAVTFQETVTYLDAIGEAISAGRAEAKKRREASKAEKKEEEK